MKVYEVILEWSDYSSTEIETKIATTKEKAVEIVNDYVLNDQSINDLYETCKESEWEDDYEYDKENGYFHANDGNNWASVYILEKDVIE